MKKIIIVLTLLIILFLVSINSYAAQETTVYVNGKQIYYDVPAQIINDRTMCPIRKTAERIGADVTWDSETQTGKITLGDRVVKLTVGDSSLNVNGQITVMDTTTIVIDDRILIPIRFVAEALDGVVLWDNRDGIVEIITDKTSVTLGGHSICMGESYESVESKIGYPSRIDKGIDRFDWYVYQKDYTKFLMVGIMDGHVISIYTAFTDFSLNNSIAFGTKGVTNYNEGYALYFDSLNENSVYGIWVGKIYSHSKFLRADFEKLRTMTEIQAIDITNAFRAKNGLPILERDNEALIAAHAHSEDMAANNYFATTSPHGKTPWTFYKENGGTRFACAENLAGGWYDAQGCFDAWVNSNAHRNNMLNRKAEFIGMGMAYNVNSYYEYYMTQLFSYHY